MNSFSPIKVIISGLCRTWKNLIPLLVCSVLPFLISVGVVMLAREMGPPLRLVLDGIHGFVVIFYLSSVIMIAGGQAPTGAMKFGFAMPPLKPLGRIFELKNTLSLIIAVAVVLSPIKIINGMFFRWVDRTFDVGDAFWFATPSHIVPEFIMTLFLGTLISSAYVKHKKIKAKAKICGINSEAALKAAIDGGASMLGFVFYPPSPRALTTIEAAKLMAMVPDGILKVALLVDPDVRDVIALGKALPIDCVQLHGNESKELVAEIKSQTDLGVIKAVAIASIEDVKLAHEFETVADFLLLDAKAPVGSSRPGGNALVFDWELIAGETWAKPWLLAGGLSPENVAQAVTMSGAKIVDVSSGVEDSLGVKNPSKIAAFLKAVV